MATLQELITSAGSVPARPESVNSLMEIIEDPVVDAEKLLPVVEKDPGLSAGLLKLCNSGFYNFKRRIGAPREALVLVGNLTFARLCFTLSLEPVLHRHLPAYNLDLDQLWQHSLATAYGSAFLVQTMGLKDLRDRAFTAGLLHDIGKLVLDGELAPEESAPAGELAPGPRPAPAGRLPDAVDSGSRSETATGGAAVSLDLERQRTGFDHAEVGAALLESWDIPDQIVAAVRWHHDPGQAKEHRRLAMAIHVADGISHFSSRVKSGSNVITTWVEKNFVGSPFPPDEIHTLANTMATKRENILSLATGPSL